MMRNNSEEFHKTHPTQLTDHLWLSAARAVTSKALFELGITSIINATLELPTVAYQKQETIQIAVEDRIASKLYIYFDLVADKIQQVHLTGGKILVYCRAGQSRSATLCIAYFMKYHGLSFDDAFQRVKSRRPIIHPNIGFIRQLKEFEQKLHLKDSMTSIAIAHTPTLARKSENIPVNFPLPVSATESFANDEELLFDSQELEEIAFRPPRLDRAKVTVHDQFRDVAQTCNVDVVNVCDKLSTEKLAPDKPLRSIHHPQPVADIGQDPTGDSTGLWDPRANKKRTAFTRLSKPNEIPVSFINLALDLVPISNRLTPFKLNINKEYCSSDFSELHQAYEVSEAVPDVCLDAIPAVGTRTCAGSRHPQSVKIHSIVCKPLASASISTNLVLESVGAPVVAASAEKKKNVEKEVTRTLSQPVSIRGQRNSFRKSRNIDQISKVSPKTVKSNGNVEKALKPNRNHSEDLLIRTAIISPVCTWESCAPVKTLRTNKIKASEKPVTIVQLQSSVITTSPCVLHSVGQHKPKQISIDNYHKLDFSVTGFEACKIVSSLIVCQLGVENSEAGKTMRFTRQYPYYSTVRLSSSLETFRAKEEVKLKTQWFNNTEKAVKAGALVRKTSQMQSQAKPLQELNLSWGTDSWVKDHFTIPLVMADHKWSEDHAVVQPADRICVGMEETTTTVYYKPDLIGRFFIPNNISRVKKSDSGAVFYTLGQSHQPFVGEMVNIFTPISVKLLFGRARKYVQGDYKLVAKTYVPSIVEFADAIPEKIVDLNYLKKFLATEKDHKKCNIWLDVYKRSLIDLKPTYADFCFISPMAVPSYHSMIIYEHPSKPLSTRQDPCQKMKLINSSLTEIHACNTTEVLVLERTNSFTNLKDLMQASDKALEVIDVSDNYTTEYFNVGWDIAKPFQHSPNASLQERAVSSVAFPNKLYSVSQLDVHGSTTPWSKSKDHHRTAFQVVSRLHGIVSQQWAVHLTLSANLPSYEFVQDVEDWPDRTVHTSDAKEQAEVEELDILWFFALDPIVKKEGPTPSNFMLFLPDPEKAPLLGQENIEGNNDVDVVSPEAVVNEVLQDINEEKSKEKQVSFKEDSPSQKPKAKVRTIYYGRDRSKSKQRLKDLHRDRSGARKRSPSRHNETEVLNNLKKSVSEANNILTRRRDYGRYDAPGTPYVRGREATRRSRASPDTFPSPLLPDADGPFKLKGIVNLAQSLFQRGPAGGGRGESNDRRQQSGYNRKY